MLPSGGSQSKADKRDEAAAAPAAARSVRLCGDRGAIVSACWSVAPFGSGEMPFFASPWGGRAVFALEKRVKLFVFFRTLDTARKNSFTTTFFFFGSFQSLDNSLFLLSLELTKESF